MRASSRAARAPLAPARAVLLEIECCADDPESFFTQAACDASRARPAYGALEMEKARARYAIAALDPGGGDANARRNALLGEIIEIDDDDDADGAEA